LVGLALLLAQSAWAQSAAASAPTPSAAASAPIAPSERAKRDADKVFQMILLHSEKKPAAKPAGKDSAAAPAPAPAAPSRSAPTAAASPAPVQNKPAPVAAAALAKPAAVEAVSQPVATPVPSAEPVVLAPAVTAPKPDIALPPTAPAVRPTAPNKLEIVTTVEPEFPNRLIRSLGTGKVLVQFDVAADGTVTQAEVVQSSHRGLESAAITAVKQWKFKPMPGPANGVTELKFE
jgi:TonB family protein